MTPYEVQTQNQDASNFMIQIVNGKIMATAAVYLEQYLDSLDSLPDEMREKFDKIRELDQKVMDDHKSAETKKLSLFKDLKSGRKMEDSEKKKRITDIQALYRNCNTLSEQKCNLASQAYELIDKHIRKLDTELARFEGELKQQQLENLTSVKKSGADSGSRDKSGGRSNASAANTSAQKGRSTQAVSETGKKKRKHDATVSEPSVLKKSNVKDSNSNTASTAVVGGQAAAILGLPEMIGASVDVLDMPVDPNEPTYCICHQVSYGEMIGCDNPDCPIEWFHFNCVGLSAKPKGKWFCSKCSAERKKKLTAVV